MDTLVLGLILIFGGAAIYFLEALLEYLFEDKSLKYTEEHDDKNVNLDDTLSMKQITEERIKNDKKIGKIIENINKNSQE